MNNDTKEFNRKLCLEQIVRSRTFYDENNKFRVRVRAKVINNHYLQLPNTETVRPLRAVSMFAVLYGGCTCTFYLYDSQ